MRIKQFQIPLWNLKREQHNSLHASAWYPICPIPETYPKRPPSPWLAYTRPMVSAPTVSSHVEFTAAYMSNYQWFVPDRVAKSVVLGMISWQIRVFVSKKEVDKSDVVRLFPCLFNRREWRKRLPRRLGRLVRA